jgi:hypothetical protein
VVKLQDEKQPAGVLLAGWDQDVGVYVWLKSQADMEEHGSRQHGGYSLGIGRFGVDSSPDWLGHPTLLPKDAFDPWQNITQLHTNAKRAAILEALSAVF